MTLLRQIGRLHVGYWWLLLNVLSLLHTVHNKCTKRYRRQFSQCVISCAIILLCNQSARNKREAELPCVRAANISSVALRFVNHTNIGPAYQPFRAWSKVRPPSSRLITGRPEVGARACADDKYTNGGGDHVVGRRPRRVRQ